MTLLYLKSIVVEFLRHLLNQVSWNITIAKCDGCSHTWCLNALYNWAITSVDKLLE